MPQFPKLLLTQRDMRVLEELLRVRLLSTAHIAALLAPGLQSDKAIVRRLQKLAKAKYVQKLFQQELFRVNPQNGKYAGRNKLAYALGPMGAQVLSDQGKAPGLDHSQWEKNNSEFKATQIHHGLMISGVYVALRQGLDEVPNMQLYDWAQGKHLYHFFYTDSRKKLALNQKPETQEGIFLQRRPVCPDAYFCLSRSDTKAALPCFLEADRGTMPTARFVEKVENYFLWNSFGLSKRAYGIDRFLVLTVTTSDARRDSLRQSVAEKLGSAIDHAMFRFASEQDYIFNPKSFVQKIWLVPASEVRYNLFA